MSIEFLNRLPDGSFPFINRHLDDDQKKYLQTLNLTPESPVEEVRRAAISSRLKFEQSGLDVASVRALRWALARTNDVMNDQEFLKFMLEGTSFEVIEDARFNFR